MIVIGADTHKSAHALAAVDAGTGVVVGELETRATEDGHRRALGWARALADERAWAIEDCRGVSSRLEQALLAVGERVVRVAPRLMGVSRRGEREPGKSDQIDARAIARAVLREGIERFPVAVLDDRALEIRLLCDHREDLVAERTRIINRLRWHLVELCPELEASIPARRLDRPRTLERIARRLRALEPSARVRIAAELVRRVRELTRRADQLERELAALVRQHRPNLLSETGCGPLTAAILIGHTAGAQRFPTDGHFARLAGVAPLPVSSGRRHRHRLHRGGDHQLKQGPAHRRHHPRAPRRRHPRIPRAQARRRQDNRRGAALPQAPPRATLPPAALTAASRKPTPRRARGHGSDSRVVLDIGATETWVSSFARMPSLAAPEIRVSATTLPEPSSTATPAPHPLSPQPNESETTLPDDSVLLAADKDAVTVVSDAVGDNLRGRVAFEHDRAERLTCDRVAHDPRPAGDAAERNGHYAGGRTVSLQTKPRKEVSK